MSEDSEKVPQEVDYHVTSVFTHTGRRKSLLDDLATADDQTLGALGYKQEFKRDFSIWESFAVSFSVLALLPSIASALGYSLGYAGRAGTVWGWLIASMAIQSVAFSMAELCSAMPTAGGLYYAGAALAPDGWAPIVSWFIGWSNFCGYVGGPCIFNYALAQMILTAIEIMNPNFKTKTWMTYLILLALLITQGLMTMQSTKTVGRINLVGMWCNIIIVIIFIIWFPVGDINSPKFNSNSAVWLQFENGTDWPIGWATCMGFLTTIWTMSGFDSPFHLCEECSNSNIASPRAIVMTAQLGLYMGWAIVIVIAYTVQSIPDVVSGKYTQPFGSLCLQVLGARSGVALFALNMVAQFFGAQGCLTTATRVVFAYSRDGAMPGSRYLSRVDRRTKTPVIAMWAISVVAALLGLLMFAGPVVIGAIFSIGAIAQYTAYTTPIVLKLFNRKKFRPGPWNLGIFSVPLNIVACGWWLLILPALCFPAVKGSALTLTSMNWTCLIYGGAMSIAMMWYALDARKWFKGPRLNVDEYVDGLSLEEAETAMSEKQHAPGLEKEK